MQLLVCFCGWHVNTLTWYFWRQCTSLGNRIPWMDGLCNSLSTLQEYCHHVTSVLCYPVQFHCLTSWTMLEWKCWASGRDLASNWKFQSQSWTLIPPMTLWSALLVFLPLGRGRAVLSCPGRQWLVFWSLPSLMRGDLQWKSEKRWPPSTPSLSLTLYSRNPTMVQGSCTKRLGKLLVTSVFYILRSFLL